jgi:hypothetical protein
MLLDPAIVLREEVCGCSPRLEIHKLMEVLAKILDANIILHDGLKFCLLGCVTVYVFLVLIRWSWNQVIWRSDFNRGWLADVVLTLDVEVLNKKLFRVVDQAVVTGLVVAKLADIDCTESLIFAAVAEIALFVI